MRRVELSCGTPLTLQHQSWPLNRGNILLCVKLRKCRKKSFWITAFLVENAAYSVVYSELLFCTTKSFYCIPVRLWRKIGVCLRLPRGVVVTMTEGGHFSLLFHSDCRRVALEHAKTLIWVFIFPRQIIVVFSHNHASIYSHLRRR